MSWPAFRLKKVAEAAKSASLALARDDGLVECDHNSAS